MKITSINRDIRHCFKVITRGDFSPIGCHKGDRYTLLEIWKKYGYASGAELGVHRADFSEAILKTIPNVRLHCVDPWTLYQNSHFSEPAQNKNYLIAVEKLKPYIDLGQAIVHKEKSQHVAKLIDDNSLDFLFIDGDHSFDGCALDLILWAPKVKRGGMVAVHDYCAQRRGGVIQAVDAYTLCHLINPWYVTREEIPTAFWVVQ